MWPEYEVSRKQLEGSRGPYTATVRLKAGMIPINLVHEIGIVGFDYGMSPRDVADGVLAGHLVLWEREVELTPGLKVASATEESHYVDAR
jgi:hypothetical protein